MDENIKCIITNVILEGLIFVEKIGERHLNDELLAEQDGIIKSFTKLLSILENIKSLEASNPPAISQTEDSNVEVHVEKVNSFPRRKPEIPPVRTSVDNYLILEQNNSYFTLRSNLPPHSYIRLSLSVNNEVKGMYYCVMEKEFILLGRKLNDQPPEYVIALENYGVKKEIPHVIKLDNNGLEVSLKFDVESDCEAWLQSILNARVSVYSYVPIRLQETKYRTCPETFYSSRPLPQPGLPPKFSPGLPPKVSDSKNNSLTVGTISKSSSFPCNMNEEVDSVSLEETNQDINENKLKSSSMKRVSLDTALESPLVLRPVLSPKRRDRPLPPPPLPPVNRAKSSPLNQKEKGRVVIIQHQEELQPEDPDLINPKSLTLNHLVKPPLSPKIPSKTQAKGIFAKSNSVPATHNGNKDMKRLEKSRKSINPQQNL